MSALFLIVALIGCVPKNTEVLDRPPEWQDAGGREKIRIDMAHALLDAGNVPQALQVLAGAARDGADSVEFDLVRGRALMMDGMYAEAKPLLTRAAEVMKKDGRPYRWLGLLEADTGHVDEAIADFQRSVAVDDSDAPSWNNLGFLLMSQGRMSDAKEALGRAVTLDGTNARYRTNLGFALASLGHDAEALESFRSVGSEAEAWSNLALARELGGSKAEAQQAYERALKADPASPSAKEGLLRLHETNPPSRSP